MCVFFLSVKSTSDYQVVVGGASATDINYFNLFRTYSLKPEDIVQERDKISFEDCLKICYQNINCTALSYLYDCYVCQISEMSMNMGYIDNFLVKSNRTNIISIVQRNHLSFFQNSC